MPLGREDLHTMPKTDNIEFPFGTLSYTEVLMLSYYATIDTQNTIPSEIEYHLVTAVGDIINDNTLHILYNKNLICRKGFSFRNNEVTYTIAPGILVQLITWLYEEKEGNDILKILSKIYKKFALNSTQVQIAVMEYVKSNYRNADYATDIFISDIEYIIPMVSDERFALFMQNMSEVAFTELIKKTFDRCYYEGRLINTDHLLAIANSREYAIDIRRDTVINSIQLYNFLAHAVKPIHKVEISEYGYILSAVVKMYSGDYKSSMVSFRKAMTIHNAQHSEAAKRGFFDENIVNFLYVVCAHRSGESDKELLLRNMLKRNTSNEAVKAAWCIAAIFTNTKGYITDLRLIFTSAQQLSRQMILLAVRFSGRNDVLTDDAYEKYAPTWAVLKYETDKYLPLDETTKKKYDAAYGAPQLSSIYVKQYWEYVLEKLMKQSTEGATTEQRTERICYLLTNIDNDGCEIRQQSILKNGGWSAGKNISINTFLNMADRNLTASDIRIRNRCRDKYATYYVPLRYVIDEMKGDNRLYVGRYAPYTLVNIVEEMPYLMIDTTPAGFVVRSNVPLNQIEDDIIITSRSASELHYLKMRDDLRPYFNQLLELSTFPPDAEPMLKTFLESLRGKVEVHTQLIEGGSTLETVKGTSNITIQMRPQGKEAYMVSIFCRTVPEGNVQCVPGEGSSMIIDVQGDHRVNVERDLEREKMLYDKLLDGVGECIPMEKTFLMDAYNLLPMLDFIRENADEYIVEWPEGQRLNIRNRYSASQWSATLKKNKNGWFEMEGNVQLDDNTVVSMAQLMDLVNGSKGRFIRLSEGEYVALSDKLRRQLSSLNAIFSHSRNKLQISPFSAALLDSSIIDGELQLDVDDELKEIRQRILDSSEYKAELPKNINATLRPYQKEGYEWISRLNSWGAGALLADDMGLGKTLQTITFILSKAEEGPALVVAPASVAPNWKTEFDKFAPSLNVHILNFAANRSTCIADAKAGDVVITTYGLLLSVKTEITKKQWNTICLDEAHVIKNRGAKTSAVAMQLRSAYRIMLTGTPVQNHLGELWNLFQFVNPGLLGSYEDFGHRFITPIEVGNDTERQKQLERIIHPFMLRRTKEKVLNELPDKTEIYQSVELSKEELAVYEVIRKKAEAMLEAEDSEKVSINTLAEITRLRQAACSAQLIEKTWKGKTSKVEALIEALEPIVESGDAALVFSQFTSFLAIIQKELKKAKIPYLYIDGSVSVKERTALVEKFQKGECPVFLISLKAGGLGLNLTHANYVFHLDPWWNPAIEQQATDRAYRIGQHNAVTVYHFLAANTIEEKIRRLHEKKRNLADNILEGTDLSSKLTGKDLLEMVR